MKFQFAVVFAMVSFVVAVITGLTVVRMVNLPIAERAFQMADLITVSGIAAGLSLAGALNAIREALHESRS